MLFSMASMILVCGDASRQLQSKYDCPRCTDHVLKGQAVDVGYMGHAAWHVLQVISGLQATSRDHESYCTQVECGMSTLQPKPAVGAEASREPLTSTTVENQALCMPVAANGQRFKFVQQMMRTYRI